LVVGGVLGGLAMLSPPAGAVPTCGGNNNIVTSPYTCTKQQVIDGTTFTVVLDVSNGGITVHYTLDAPRLADTPIRIRSHLGISSTGTSPTEQSGTIAAGATSAVLSVPLSCGQIDVKAVFTGNGDSRGRITAPYVTDTSNCATAPSSTSTSSTTAATTTTSVSTTTTPASTTPPSTPPAATSIATTTPPGSGSLPVTGRGRGLGEAGLLLVGAGALLLAIGRGRRRHLVK
jgi:hypothetical protein